MVGARIRLSMPWGDNIYRVDEINQFGCVTKASAFTKDREVRSAIGRWSSCPNFNVLLRLTGAI